MLVNCTLNMSGWVICTCFSVSVSCTPQMDFLFMHMRLRNNHGKWVEKCEADSTLTVQFTTPVGQ